MVENASRQKLKVFHTDNGGEFTSTKFEEFLKSKGIHHECTIPKTSEQKWCGGEIKSNFGRNCSLNVD